MRPQMSEKKSEKVKVSEVITFREDLMVLTKIRLNTFVLITTLFGFILSTMSLGTGWAGWTGDQWWKLVHTLIGTGAAAFGSAAFNQLMEIEQDRQMRRTQNRPLPSRRMNVITAFMMHLDYI